MIYRMKKLLLLILAFAISLSSCKKPDSGKDDEPYLKSVELDAESNALRVGVSVTTSKDCHYSIICWEQAQGKEKACTTKIYSSATGLHGAVKYLKPNTAYSLLVKVQEDGSESEVIDFTTTALPEDLPVYELIKSTEGDKLDGYIFQCENSLPGYVTLCDYDGNVVWYDTYGKGIRTIFYDPATGYLLMTIGLLPRDPSIDRLCEDLVIADLDGNIILSKPSDSKFVEYVHHEFCITEDQKLIILANDVKQYNDRDCWGESFYVSDMQGNIEFSWNQWKEFNPDKDSWYSYDPSVNDYIHANSVTRDSNGDYYISMNWITEVWKISGKTGEVLYRFGEHGNVALTGQPIAGNTVWNPEKHLEGGIHSVTVIEPDYLLFYNNGRQTNAKISRGVFVRIDPVSKKGYFERIIDLPKPQFSANRSNVQILPGNRLLFCNTAAKRLCVTDMEGNILRTISREDISYRAYWFPTDQLQ